MNWHYAEQPDPLIGRKVTAVWFSDEYLTFDTDGGLITYTVEGDCCSSSYFNDFVGLQKLLDNGPVTEFKSIPLDDSKEREEEWRNTTEYGEEVEFYGCALTTVSERWGEMTTVFSFRNESNGYYGGWMNQGTVPGFVHESQRKLTEDVVTG